MGIVVFKLTTDAFVSISSLCFVGIESSINMIKTRDSTLSYYKREVC